MPAGSSANRPAGAWGRQASHKTSRLPPPKAPCRTLSWRSRALILLRGVAGKEVFPAGELVGIGRSVQDAIDAFLKQEREP